MAKHWIVAALWSILWAILGVYLASIICVRFVPDPVAPGRAAPVFSFLFLEYLRYSNGTPYLIVDMLVIKVHPVGWTQILITLAGGIGAFSLSMYSHRPRHRPAADVPADSEPPAFSETPPPESGRQDSPEQGPPTENAG